MIDGPDSLDAEELDRLKAERRARAEAIYRSWQSPEAPASPQRRPTSPQPPPIPSGDMSLGTEFGHGLARGGAQIGEAVGTGLKVAGIVTHSDRLRAAGEKTAATWSEIASRFPKSTAAEGNVWEEGNWHDLRWLTASVAETIPSLAAAMVPAGGVMKGIRIGEKILRWTPMTALKLSRIGAAVGGIAGGSMEGSSTFEYVKGRGGSDEDAVRSYALMGLASAGLNAISFGRMFTPGTVAGRMAKSGGIEALTEYLESPAQAIIVGDDVIQSLKEGLNVLPAAMITGAAGGAVGGHGAASDKAKPGTIQGGPDLTQAPEATPTPTTGTAGPAPTTVRVFHGAATADAPLGSDQIFTDSPHEASAYAEVAAIRKAMENNDAFNEIVSDVMAEEGAEDLTDLSTQTLRDIISGNEITVDGEIPQGVVREATISYRNPLDLRELGSSASDVESLWTALHDKGLVDEAWAAMDEDARQSVIDDYEGKAAYRLFEGEGVYQRAFKSGYDAVIFEDQGTEGKTAHDSYVVADPSQVTGTAGEAEPAALGQTAKDLQGIPLHVNLDHTGASPYRRIAAGIDRLNAEVMAEDRARRPLDEIRDEGHGYLPDLESAATFDMAQPIEPGKLPAIQRALEDYEKTSHAFIDEILRRPKDDPTRLPDLAAALGVARALAIQVEYGKSISGRHLRVQQMPPMFQYEPFTRADLSSLSDQLLAGDMPIEVAAELLQQVSRESKAAGQRTFINRWVDGIRRGSSMAYEAWIAGLVSNPQTLAGANPFSSAIMNLYALRDRYIAERVPGSSVAHGESAAMLYAYTHTWGESMRAALKAFRTGVDPSGITKMESNQAAITAKNAGVSDESGLGKGINLLGSMVRTSLRGLMATDVFFKTMNYRAELKAQALRQATREAAAHLEATGKAWSDGDLAARVADLEEHPSDRIDEAAKQFALYQTFQNEMGAAGKKLQGLMQESRIGKVVVPFIRTPTNIIARAIQSTGVVQFLSPEMWRDLNSRGPRRDLAIGRVVSGSFTAAALGTVAAAGFISGGGPKDKELLDQLKSTGWQPYSIKIGDTWYAYNRTDPIGISIGLVADFTEIAGHLPDYQLAELGMAVALAIAKNITSKTYTVGIANAIDAISQPDRGAHAYAAGLARSMVPAWLRAVERYEDPTMRETVTLMDEIRAGVPGWGSSELPPSRNLYGEPILMMGGLGPDLVSPIYTSTEKHDPVKDEVARLATMGMRLTMPSRVIFGTTPPDLRMEPERVREGIELTPAQYDRYVMLAAKGLKEDLAKRFASKAYQQASDGPDEGKALIIRSLIQAHRERGRMQLIAEDAGLKDAIVGRFKERAQAMRPQRQMDVRMAP